jgi:hypothetical protein
MRQLDDATSSIRWRRPDPDQPGKGQWPHVLARGRAIEVETIREVIDRNGAEFVEHSENGVLRRAQAARRKHGVIEIRNATRRSP